MTKPQTISPEEAVSRYLALSYGYSADGSGKDRRAVVLSPEDEEFQECDARLLESCAQAGDGGRHIRQISSNDEFIIFERKVGNILHRFRSKFVPGSGESEGKLVAQQYTEILAPEHFGDKTLVFDLNKELGEAGCLFQSALVLSNFMSDTECVLSTYMTGQKRLIELGSGTGIVGIVIAQLGQHITLTDMAHVLPQIHHNVSANLDEEASERVRISPLSWGNEAEIEELGKFDLILCSDLVYKEETKEALVTTLVALSTPASVVAMAFERRRKAVEDAFMAHAAKYFDFEELKVPYQEDNGVLVYLMRPR